jgi:adenylosuccinate synthase
MGAQWGDEGKGKLVDMLGDQFQVTARCAGGSNAGHTVVVQGKKYAFHLLPSGILHANNVCLIGNGVVLHLPTFLKELKNLDDKEVNYEGRILLGDRAHLLFDLHQEVDGRQEDAKMAGAAIGTTRRGIGPCYSAKASRIGIRLTDLKLKDTFGDKFNNLVKFYQKTYPDLKVDVDAEVKKYLDIYERIKPYVVDSVDYINTAYENGKRIMIEGANATMLDIDFGTYPFVTSSNASIGGAITGLGLAPTKLEKVIGISKAYVTRVGAGPFPTELKSDIGDKIREIGREYGTTTGRPRRCGWIDIVALKYVSRINGFHYINLTKLDVLSTLEEIKIAVGYSYEGTKYTNTYPSNIEILGKCEVEYETFPGWKSDISKARRMEDLPKKAVDLVKRIEHLVGVPIKWIGVGPGREDMVIR